MDFFKALFSLFETIIVGFVKLAITLFIVCGLIVILLGS